MKTVLVAALLASPGQFSQVFPGTNDGVSGFTPLKSNSSTVSFFGDIFGSSALKVDCVKLWSGRGSSSDRKKCNQARQEIAYAKTAYPRIYTVANSLKNGFPALSFSDKVAYLDEMSQSCADQSASRAANTVRYWGNRGVGSNERIKNMVIKSLARLDGATNYQVVLEACDPNSWISIRKASLGSEIKGEWLRLSSNTQQDVSICSHSKLLANRAKVGSQDVNNIRSKSRSLVSDRDSLGSIYALSSNIKDASYAIGESEYQQVRARLSSDITTCSQAEKIALKYQQENQARLAKEKADKERRIAEQRRIKAEQDRIRNEQIRKQKEIESFNQMVDSVQLD